MSPRAADPDMRRALVEAAARLLATEGPGKLTLRRLTREVGASTMAVYTYFGSMDELRREVRREGFRRLAERLGAVRETGDPVADLVGLGAAYWGTATEFPNLYRAMFLDGPVSGADADVGADTFAILVAAMGRCVESGRFDPADPEDLALQVWSLTHGIVALLLAHMLDEPAALHAFDVGSRSLFKAFGDEPRATGGSFSRGLAPAVD